MAEQKKEIADFYDQFSDHQVKLGVNIRHRTIFSNLKKAGLTSSSKVLEIGCGIGTVSSLIIPYISNGSFLGVDISKESIEIAQKRNSNYKNAGFMVSDMSDFKTEEKYDFFVLPDVLEHIPVEQHPALFQTLGNHAHEKSVILINIPEPYTLDWTRQHNPAALQIIDQSLSLQDLCNSIYPAGFYLFSVCPYGLQYQHEEYLAIVCKRNTRRERVEFRGKLDLGLRNLLSKFR